MATLREFLTGQYDWTGLASRVLSSRAWHLGALAGSALLTLALIVLYHVLYVQLPFPAFAAVPMGLEHTFPTMVHFTRVVMLVPLAMLFTHSARMWWLTMREVRAPASAYAAEAIVYARAAVAPSTWRRCPDNRRWVGHWLLAAGTEIMLVVKTFGLRWFQTDAIYPLYHPQRWLGYLATAFIVYGIFTILEGRARARAEYHKHTRLEDLIFPILLLLTALTGISAHIFRYAGLALASHIAYALHVVIATPMLVVEMSFGKWSHMMYRVLALYFAAVQSRAGRQRPAGEAVGHAA
jgi:heterodisulfide reductase subunit C/quinone-modifying oxidoreductase subunit QmoC